MTFLACYIVIEIDLILFCAIRYGCEQLIMDLCAIKSNETKRKNNSFWNNIFMLNKSTVIFYMD